MAYLQSATVVLEDKGNRAPIAMSRHPHHGLAFKVSCGDRRVMQEAQLIVVSRMGFKEVILVRKADADGHGSKDHFGSLVAFPIEFRGKFSEAGEYIFRQPDVGLVTVAFATNFVAFLGDDKLRML